MNSVTLQVDRHLEGKLHKAACLLYSRQPEEEQFQRIARKRPVVPDICTALSKTDQDHEAYLKLMRTAYEMALNLNFAAF